MRIHIGIGPVIAHLGAFVLRWCCLAILVVIAARSPAWLPRGRARRAVSQATA